MIDVYTLPLGPLQTNAYVVVCSQTNSAAVIDPSWDGGRIADLTRERKWQVTHVLLTHAHFDHVGGLVALTEEVNAPVYLHPDASPMLARAAASAQRWGLKITQPSMPTTDLEDGQTIDVGDVSLSVLYTPGHAPGHVSFHVPSSAVVFDGDVLFQQGIGRTDLPGGDYQTLLRSIRDKLLTLPDETTVFPGHGAATTIGEERRTNPFLRGLAR